MAACSGAVVVTDDADRFHQALRPSGGNFTVTAPGVFAAKHVRIDLPRVLMQGAQETLPRIWEGDLSHERHVISCQISPGPSLFANGAEIGPGEIVLHSSSAAMLCHRTTGPTRWGGMSLPSRDWEAIAIAVGHDLTPRADVPKITVPETALTRFRRLHASAMDMAENAPQHLANPDAAHGLEYELVQAMTDCLAMSGNPSSTAATRRHATIMKRFYQALEASVDEPIYLPQLCIAIGASDRTLRLCCQEYLGIGPKRYLHLRRMHLARRALLRAAAGTDNVTTIATRFGFWELGRFAVDYHMLFGEAPSTTLRSARPRRARAAALLLPFLHS
jgi:AraC-like DNA-binding protein